MILLLDQALNILTDEVVELLVREPVQVAVDASFRLLLLMKAILSFFVMALYGILPESRST